MPQTLTDMVQRSCTWIHDTNLLFNLTWQQKLAFLTFCISVSGYIQSSDINIDGKIDLFQPYPRAFDGKFDQSLFDLGSRPCHNITCTDM